MTAALKLQAAELVNLNGTADWFADNYSWHFQGNSPDQNSVVGLVST